MSDPTRIYPVPRQRVLAAALVFLAVLAGVAGLANALRHPPAVSPLADPYEPADPRDEVECPPSPSPTETPVTAGSGDLYNCPHTFDGLVVRFEGEVVGAVLFRPDGAWVQLNDDHYAGELGPLPEHRQFRGGNSGIGVHLPRHLAEDIASIGGPNTRGDVIAVTGTYRLSDTAGGEVSVIRARTVEIIRPGGPTSREPLRNRQVAGGFLFLFAAASLGIPRLIAGRQ
jgi:hypothetical protein